MEEYRVCKQCGINKPITEFHLGSTYKGGRKPICAECFNDNHINPISKFNIAIKWQLLALGIKYCPKCDSYKAIEAFGESRGRKDGLAVYCKECNRLDSLERDRSPEGKAKRKARESTPEFSAHLSQYRGTSDKFKVSKKRYDSSPKGISTKKAYEKRLDRRLRGKISIKIYSALKSQNMKKSLEFDEYLGCTPAFFREYITSLFQTGMSWDNWGRGEGKWHIDHIKPCASFDLKDEEQQKICFNYKNQQPLWEKDNLQKNSKYDGIHYSHKNKQ